MMPPRFDRRLLTMNSVALMAMAAAGCAPQGQTSAPPLRIVATDSGFVLPRRVPAGLTQVRLVNRGSIVHEGILVHFIAPGSAAAYADSFRAGSTWLETGRRGESPVIPLGGSGSLVRGREVWLPMTLTPGRYFMFCEVETKRSGIPHYRHGMYREFVVPEAKP